MFGNSNNVYWSFPLPLSGQVSELPGAISSGTKIVDAFDAVALPYKKGSSNEADAAPTPKAKAVVKAKAKAKK